MQGFNIRAKIQRPTVTDDSYGGSVTVWNDHILNIPCRIQHFLMRQKMDRFRGGAKTEKVFRVTSRPTSTDIRENDRFIITKPSDHWYSNINFKVIKVDHGNYNPKNYVILTVSIVEEAGTV